jgi:hypothetical protein
MGQTFVLPVAAHILSILCYTMLSHKVSAMYFFNVVVLSAPLIMHAAKSMDSLRHCEAVSALIGQL